MSRVRLRPVATAWATHDLSRHLELQNNASVVHGTHTTSFGVRLSRDNDESNQPGGFNGALTFLGGTAPMLDASNQIVYDSSGQPVTVTLTSLQQYERNVLLSQAGLTQAQVQIWAAAHRVSQSRPGNHTSVGFAGSRGPSSRTTGAYVLT